MARKRRSGIPVSTLADDEISKALDIGIKRATAPIRDPVEIEVSIALEMGIREATAPILDTDAVPTTVEDEISEALNASLAAITVQPADGDAPEGSPHGDDED